MKGCWPSLKSCKIRNSQWSLDREKVWILSAWYRRAMPDQEGSLPPAHILTRLTALLPAPLSLARLLPMGVSALKSVLGSSAQKHSPDTDAPAFPYHEAQPFSTAQLGLHLHLAALSTWTRCRQPQIFKLSCWSAVQKLWQSSCSPKWPTGGMLGWRLSILPSWAELSLQKA